jgi:membrane protein YdbS with pleckstrin-like domain
MLERLRAAILRVLRVPPQPEPPRGAPGSVRVFRAGRNFYKLRLLRWLFAQIGAAAGLAISLYFLAGVREVELRTRAQREEAERPAARAAGEATSVVASEGPKAAELGPEAEPAVTAAPEARAGRVERWAYRIIPRVAMEGTGRFMAGLPPWVSTLVTLAEIAGVIGFFLQIPVTFAAVRLDFEQHWYVVTDRSLRIRSGLLEVREATMSFANVQQVTVRQGPVQRWLGLADVEVRSAGGGSLDDPEKRRESMHHGLFEGVEHATEIRDLILARLKRFREAGLGDPEDDRAPAVAAGVDDAEDHLAADSPAAAPSEAAESRAEVLAAAQALLAEARALRQALEQPGRG